MNLRDEFNHLLDLSRTTVMNQVDKDRLYALQDHFASDGVGQPPPHGHDSWAEYALAEHYNKQKVIQLQSNYEVIVGNVGCFPFDSESEAEKWFDDYVELSKTDKGHRVYGEDVTMFEHTGESSEIILEYRGHLAQNEEFE